MTGTLPQNLADRTFFEDSPKTKIAKFIKGDKQDFVFLDLA